MASVDIHEYSRSATSLNPSMTQRVIHSYFDMRGATEEFIAERPSEGRLLQVIMLSNMFFVLSWCMKAIIAPASVASETVGTDIILWLAVAMMMRTTLVYGTALFTGLVCKIMGGQASLQETRAGVFWGAVVAAPIGLVITVTAAVIVTLSDVIPLFQNGNVQMVPYWLGTVPFIWFISKGAATANRMDSAVPLFGILSAVCVGLVYVVRVFGSGAV